MDKTGMGETGEIFIINKYGYMITPSRFEKGTFLKRKVDTLNSRLALRHKNKRHSLLEPELQKVFLDYRGKESIGAHQVLPKMQWCFLGKIEAKEALASLIVVRIFFIVVFFFVAIIAWLAGISIGKTITAPSNRLHKGTETIGSGKLSHKVATDADDEVGLLSRAFDAMTAKLEKSTTVFLNLKLD